MYVTTGNNSRFFMSINLENRHQLSSIQFTYTSYKCNDLIRDFGFLPDQSVLNFCPNGSSDAALRRHPSSSDIRIVLLASKEIYETSHNHDPSQD